MANPKLRYKPLVEAMLEVRWSLDPKMPGVAVDPHYQLLLARFFDRLNKEYPEHEQLQTAMMPDELFGHFPQHRFRVSKDGWPLVQIGPGIITANSTDDYTWEDFHPRTIRAVNTLFDAYPKPAELKIETLTLRYVDAIAFDYLTDDVLVFLSDKLKVSLAFPSDLFKEGVNSRPSGLVLSSSFPCQAPKGTVHVQFATGKKMDAPALLWETSLQSARDELPDLPSGFAGWIDAAHKVTGGWFSKLIEGELQRRFTGEQV
jgi:uncharacterized protein (TIGR04255 family)